VSLSNSLTPTGNLDTWRVTESSPVNFTSVEYIVSNASIVDSAMVQNSLSGYGPIGA
jgi:Ni,Fe-hydrogenase III large subunit